MPLFSPRVKEFIYIKPSVSEKVGGITHRRFSVDYYSISGAKMQAFFHILAGTEKINRAKGEGKTIFMQFCNENFHVSLDNLIKKVYTNA